MTGFWGAFWEWIDGRGGSGPARFRRTGAVAAVCALLFVTGFATEHLRGRYRVRHIARRHPARLSSLFVRPSTTHLSPRAGAGATGGARSPAAKAGRDRSTASDASAAFDAAARRRERERAREREQWEHLPVGRYLTWLDHLDGQRRAFAAEADKYAGRAEEAWKRERRDSDDWARSEQEFRQHLDGLRVALARYRQFESALVTSRPPTNCEGLRRAYLDAVRHSAAALEHKIRAMETAGTDPASVRYVLDNVFTERQVRQMQEQEAQAYRQADEELRRVRSWYRGPYTPSLMNISR